MFKCSQVLLALLFKRQLSFQVLKPFESSMQNNSSVDVVFSNVDKKFKLILDVRSPAEFMIDHLPGAVNIPVLDNEERCDVGKIYDRDDPVAARLLGSSLIMKNLSKYIECGGILYQCLQERITTDSDRILVYCAKGGKRSKSVAIVLSEIGFTTQPVCVLDGGYRAYRKQILMDLKRLPDEISFVGVCGLTGSAKTKILHCLRKCGEAVLDLEDLAKHKGSVFGGCVDLDKSKNNVTLVQPSQKHFDSMLWTELTRFCNMESIRKCKNNRPIVWLECESRNIGRIMLGDSIWKQIQNSKRIIITSSMTERVKHIMTDYRYLTETQYLSITKSMINWLSATNPRSVIDQWQYMVDYGKFEELVESLLKQQYDPIYTRNRQSFLTSRDTDHVIHVFAESLGTSYIENELCTKLIKLSESWLQ